MARQLLEDAGLAHELRPRSGNALAQPEQTDDAVLGGRLRLLQKRRGHRVGHDAILLAAATHAHRGDHAVDLGAGIGAAGLALAVRVADVTVTLVEIDPELVALAEQNIARNGLDQRVRAVTLDVTAPSDQFAAARPWAGLRRPRADESAVQQRRAAERFARSAAARSPCGAGWRACRIGCAPRTGSCIPPAR